MFSIIEAGVHDILPSAQENPDFSVLISPAFLQSNPNHFYSKLQILATVFFGSQKFYSYSLDLPPNAFSKLTQQRLPSSLYGLHQKRRVLSFNSS
jgi:hypothetical protein